MQGKKIVSKNGSRTQVVTVVENTMDPISKLHYFNEIDRKMVWHDQGTSTQSSVSSTTVKVSRTNTTLKRGRTSRMTIGRLSNSSAFLDIEERKEFLLSCVPTEVDDAYKSPTSQTRRLPGLSGSILGRRESSPTERMTTADKTICWTRIVEVDESEVMVEMLIHVPGVKTLKGLEKKLCAT